MNVKEGPLHYTMAEISDHWIMAGISEWKWEKDHYIV